MYAIDVAAFGHYLRSYRRPHRYGLESYRLAF